MVSTQIINPNAPVIVANAVGPSMWFWCQEWLVIFRYSSRPEYKAGYRSKSGMTGAGGVMVWGVTSIQANSPTLTPRHCGERRNPSM